MTLYSGFFNAISGDRTYDAKQMSRLFDGIITDGVFASIGTAFTVSPSSGMNISIGIGRAWFDHTWTFNDSVMILALEQSEVVLDRLDRIVLEIDTSDEVRANSIKVIKGTPASTPIPPTLVKTATLNQYPLATISVLAGDTIIGAEKITNEVGTTECPFITGILEPIDIATFLAQWNAQFDIWFDDIKDQLSTDAAGNLQNQINNIPILTKASGEEVKAGANDVKYVTPLALKSYPGVPTASVLQITRRSVLPNGYLKTDGSEVSRITYADLFAEIGTNFGPGDGVNTFNLPLVNGTMLDPVLGTVIPAARSYHTLTALPDGRILLIAGYTGSASSANTYFGTISGNTITWVAGTALPAVRNAHATVLLPDGRILVTGGHDGTARSAVTYFGTISGDTIGWVTGTALPEALNSHQMVVLTDGRILIVGGTSNSVSAVTTTRFGTISGNTITWAVGTALAVGRQGFGLVRLSDNRIVVVGGFDGTNKRSDVMFGTISANTITWLVTSSLPIGLNNISLILSSDDKLILSGGSMTTTTSPYNTSVSDIYIGNVSGTILSWSRVSALPEPRNNLASVFDSHGRCILTGGYNSSSAVVNTTYIANFLMGVIKT